MEEQKQEKYLVKVEPLPGKEDQFDVTELRGGRAACDGFLIFAHGPEKSCVLIHKLNMIELAELIYQNPNLRAAAMLSMALSASKKGDKK